MQDKFRFSELSEVRNVLEVFLVDTYPHLEAEFLCTPGLEKEVKFCGPRTSYSELLIREMACRTRSNDRRLTPQPTEIGEYSVSDSVGFEPGAE